MSSQPLTPFHPGTDSRPEEALTDWPRTRQWSPGQAGDLAADAAPSRLAAPRALQRTPEALESQQIAAQRARVARQQRLIAGRTLGIASVALGAAAHGIRLLQAPADEPARDDGGMWLGLAAALLLLAIGSAWRSVRRLRRLPHRQRRR